MQESGHIYVMVNPSMEGLVKIGKTTREPESRAKELSQATGVATPFYVAFSIPVPDCHAAEQFVHELLESSGFRRSPNREFFQIPVKKAIEAVLLAEKEFEGRGVNVSDPDTEESAELSLGADEGEEPIEEHPGEDVFEKAMDTYYGRGDELLDINEGVRLLYSAKALNYPAAFIYLAYHFLGQVNEIMIETGEFDSAAIRSHRDKAVQMLKEGGTKGHGCCWVTLAQLFSDGTLHPEGTPDPESALKCWKRYFQCDRFLKDDKQKWTESTSTGLGDASAERLSYIKMFLENVAAKKLALKPDIRTLLTPFKSELLEDLYQSIEYGANNNGHDYARECGDLADFVLKVL